MTIESGPGSPLQTIHFVMHNDEITAIRDWYTVPRIGEVIALDGWIGTVESVVWSDEYVTVRVFE